MEQNSFFYRLTREISEAKVDPVPIPVCRERELNVFLFWKADHLTMERKRKRFLPFLAPLSR